MRPQLEFKVHVATIAVQRWYTLLYCVGLLTANMIEGDDLRYS